MMKKKYSFLLPPYMIHKEPYEGVTSMGDFADVLYKIDSEDLYLTATSEHSLTSMYMNEVMEEKDLPSKSIGVSPCFRKEAGAHGKDTKGIFRGHQFHKVEQIILCKPEESWKYHEELIKNAIEFFESLELHFRQINICTGDIGIVASKKYDLEVWMPAQQQYREVVSCSNCTDYQARRLDIRYRGNTNEGNPFVHTLNSTVVATSRAIVAILENYQTKDGTIKIPKVLQPYMNGITEIKKKK
jgi:seryl-tRNA synthetase